MPTPLAWRNVTHKKLRTAAALAGVCFAIVLIFMQLGFYDVCFRSSTMILDQFAFDIALVSPQYVHLRAAQTVPRQRLAQARAVDGVAAVSRLYVANGNWRNAETGARRELPILGIDPDEPCFRLPELAARAGRLREIDTALMDERAQSSYGPIYEGLVGELEDRRIEIAGTYAYGSGFVSDASIVVSDRTLLRHAPGTSSEAVSIGLVTLEPGTSVRAAAAALARHLPSDVRVHTREELEAQEQRYFVRLKPLGVMFASGVVLALAVGSIILYQILSAEVANHVREFATLKAMGYEDGFLVFVVLQQATIFAILGYGPALVLTQVLYTVVRFVTNLPMAMTAGRLLAVLLLSVLMCSISGLLASRKVGRADPADLF